MFISLEQGKWKKKGPFSSSFFTPLFFWAFLITPVEAHHLSFSETTLSAAVAISQWTIGFFFFERTAMNNWLSQLQSLLGLLPSWPNNGPSTSLLVSFSVRPCGFFFVHQRKAERLNLVVTTNPRGDGYALLSGELTGEARGAPRAKGASCSTRIPDASSPPSEKKKQLRHCCLNGTNMNCYFHF
jgi:hypothetical protein